MREWISPDGRVRLVQADCLEVLPTLEPGSVDAVIADLPYGTTACKWDQVIPFEPLWAGYKHAAKKNAAIVLTASQPFTSALVMSNPKWFRYEWIWHKNYGSNFAVARKQAFKEHENVCVFYREQPTYNPQMEPRSATGQAFVASCSYDRRTSQHSSMSTAKANRDPEKRLPGSVRRFNMEVGFHPTQKPVALMEYLIRTYTNEGELVLDNTMGSGTTGVACIATGRRFVGIEKDPGIYDTAVARIQAELAKTTLFQESA